MVIFEPMAMSTIALRLHSTQQIAQQCASEQQLQVQGNACHELLRRAFEDHSDEAWRAFEAQFGALLAYWVHQDMARYGLPAPDEVDVADIRSEGLTRFIDRYAGKFSVNFEHTGAALSVLHKCMCSCVQERQRVRQRAVKLNVALQQEAISHNRGDLSMLGQMQLEELRRCIHELLVQDVPEEHLRLLIELRFGLDLKPRQITAHDPEHFPSVDYVNDQIDRLLKRLRRRIDIYTQKCL